MSALLSLGVWRVVTSLPILLSLYVAPVGLGFTLEPIQNLRIVTLVNGGFASITDSLVTEASWEGVGIPERINVYHPDAIESVPPHHVPCAGKGMVRIDFREGVAVPEVSSTSGRSWFVARRVNFTLCQKNVGASRHNDMSLDADSVAVVSMPDAIGEFQISSLKPLLLVLIPLRENVAIASMESSIARIDGSTYRSGESEKPTQCLQPPCPKLLAGDLRLRLRGIGGPSLLYKIGCILAINFGLLGTVIAFAKAGRAISDRRQCLWLTLAASGAILAVSGVGFAING